MAPCTYLGVREAARDSSLGLVPRAAGREETDHRTDATYCQLPGVCFSEGAGVGARVSTLGVLKVTVLGAQVLGGGGAAVRHHAGERSHRPAVEPWRSVSHRTHIPA